MRTAALSGYFAWLMREGLLEQNPSSIPTSPRRVRPATAFSATMNCAPLGRARRRRLLRHLQIAGLHRLPPRRDRRSALGRDQPRRGADRDSGRAHEERQAAPGPLSGARAGDPEEARGAIATTFSAAARSRVSGLELAAQGPRRSDRRPASNLGPARFSPAGVDRDARAARYSNRTSSSHSGAYRASSGIAGTYNRLRTSPRSVAPWSTGPTTSWPLWCLASQQRRWSCKIAQA